MWKGCNCACSTVTCSARSNGIVVERERWRSAALSLFALLLHPDLQPTLTPTDRSLLTSACLDTDYMKHEHS